LKEEIGEMRDDEMATERWENEGGHTLTKYAIARFVRAFQSRLETDPLGEVSVPAIALYGVQTQRARDNFRVSNLRIHPALITAYAEIKQSAAEANRATGAFKAALHNQELGFMGAAKLAQRAIDSGKSVREALGEANKPGKGSKYGSAN
jgi:fumarate hydratase class II